jgi:hypothetical protein
MRLFNLRGVLAPLCCTLAFLTFTLVPACYAQDVSGMTGTVTDQSGAAIPGAAVVLTNAATGAKYTQTSNSIGYYRFAQIPPGAGYTASFTAKGFAPVTVANITLLVGQVRTQNATMSVGAQVSTVEVTASNAVVTIDTTDATVGNNLDVQALNNLPVQQRDNPTALFAMQPGVTDSGSVTGARVDQNDVSLDGLDVNDFATGGATQDNSGAGVHSSIGGLPIVGNAPIDSVEQFTGTVAGNEANTGPSSGGQFQLVTKSGTNKFHGNLNEYHRDEDLVANSWFSNNSNPIVPRNHLIQNQFGGNIGGPIKRDKAFFFFDFNQSRIIRSSLVQRTVPLDTYRAGNIGYIDNSSTPNAPHVSYMSPSQVAAIDPQGVGENQPWLAIFTKRFPHSNNNVTGDGVNSGGYSFNSPFNDNDTTYVGRIDYHLTSTQNLWGRFTINRENGVYNPNEFPGDPVTNPVVDRSYAAVIGHTWVLGNNKTNQVIFGETVQKLSYPDPYNPAGSTFLIFDDGTGPALTSAEYLQPGSQARRVPVPVLRDDFAWTKGAHNWQFGGSFKDILAHDSLVNDYNTAEIAMGGNILNLCSVCNSGASPSLRPSGIYNAPTGASDAQSNLQDTAYYDWDQAFTYMLGRIAEISSVFNYDHSGNPFKQLTGDQRLYRYYQTQLYFQDNWKMTPSLTVTYGVTYQYFSVPYEVHGLESIEPYSFDSYFGARVKQSDASLSGPTAIPLIPYLFGGKGNGSKAPPLYQPQHKEFAPHIGIAWNPSFDRKAVFNVSGGLVWDRTVISAIQHIQDQDSYLFQQSLPTPEGITGDPWNSLATDPRLDSNGDISAVSITPPATPKPPYYPFVDSNGNPIGLQLGSAFNATIDPTLRDPYSIVLNAGFQRSMPWNMIMKINYVGRMGRRLIGQADANQVLDFVDKASGQSLGQAFSSATLQMRNGATGSTIQPQPWFENEMTGYQPKPPKPQYASATQFMVDNVGSLVKRGDFGDVAQFLSYFTAPNIGSAAQFSENTFYGNKGFSTYHGLLFTLQKNLSNGLNYDFNYTWSHSIDNVSLFANSMGDTGIGGVGLICDAVRPRECRSNSDFDITQYVTSDASYQLPFGKGREFLGGVSNGVNEIIGGWALSGVGTWHSGRAWGTDSNAFVASYSNNAPGILVGPKSSVATHLTKLPGGGVNIFANNATARAAYTGPVGFQIGPRNSLRGPHYFNADLGLAKAFPITSERTTLNFRADAFNALNHPNFDVPANNVYNGLDQQDVTSSTFGTISYTIEPPGNLNNGARVLQLSLRLEF